jgi:hypothetical protein
VTPSLLEVGFNKVIAAGEECPGSEEVTDVASDEEGEGNHDCNQSTARSELLGTGHPQSIRKFGNVGERHGNRKLKFGRMPKVLWAPGPLLSIYKSSSHLCRILIAM